MDFWCGVALTLLLETVALIVAAEKLRKKIRGRVEDDRTGKVLD